MENNFDLVWERIKEHEGETFTQIKGKKFTYEVQGNSLKPNTVNRIIPNSEIKKALNFVPLPNTVVIHNLQAPSYLYAILMDKRIRENLW